MDKTNGCDESMTESEFDGIPGLHPTQAQTSQHIKFYAIGMVNLFLGSAAYLDLTRLPISAETRTLTRYTGH